MTHPPIPTDTARHLWQAFAAAQLGAALLLAVLLIATHLTEGL